MNISSVALKSSGQSWQLILADLALILFLLTLSALPAAEAESGRFPLDAERLPWRDWFLDRGYEVSLMPRDIPFEGAGDALLDRGAQRAQRGLWPHLRALNRIFTQIHANFRERKRILLNRE